ncbi:MAG TPA: tetraacyldisaccharide 4'-kinase [Burkholderiaceae bacterium]|nr:tetraacyldisaccharide 4'-kinase [Burkholderiaceae bacterium]
MQAAWLSRGWLARVLLPVSWLYGLVIALRAACYRLGLLRTERLPVPVLVVGNLVAGGAGKTPTTIALIQLLRDRGYTPGIISRGYGRPSDEVAMVHRQLPASQSGDEPLLMHLRTNAPVAVGADRVAAGLTLLARHPEVDMLVSDDGLQHLRLARDAQVIVFDERGAGNGWLLPSGPLRQPVPRNVPPHSAVLYNADAPSTALPGHLAQRRLAGFTSLQSWWAGEATSHGVLAALRGRRVLAAAGLARPQRFFGMLRATGLDIDELPLPDHHDFATLPWPAGTADVIVTEKDAVKLRPEAIGTTRVWVATLDFELSAAFADALMQQLPPPTRT